MELIDAFQALFYIFIVATVTPLLAALFRGFVPGVVVLLLGGVLIGPELLGLADPVPVALIGNLGLGFLFLLAGFELDAMLMRSQPGRLALIAWGITIVLSLMVVGLLEVIGQVKAFVPVAIALTTTALGTLLPMLKEQNMLASRLGRYIFAAGTVGELGPILAIALFLGANETWVQLLAIVAVAIVVWALTQIPRFVRGNVIGRTVLANENATSQATLRLTVLLLIALLLLTEELEIDIVLGAFLAGMVLRRWAPGDIHELERKLEIVGHGIFIPVFFVWSGMKLDVDAILDAPERTIAVFVLLLLVRGLPALFVYRGVLPMSERVQLMFLSATALPLLVAIAEIGQRDGVMLPSNAAALVGGGVLSVAVFPLVAVLIRRRRPAPADATMTTLPIVTDER
ncbi:MAG: cation:proton antiporter [Candidatus Nanopelagicales bacterium]